MTRRRGTWSVLAVNGIVAGTVLALVAALALVVNPPAPPGIAAFAPQATKPITKAPQAQSAANGDGAGECAAQQACARPSPSRSQPVAGARPVSQASPPAKRGAPSALQCYAWPNGTVTQTFDPQSPPCIATWDETKGNGGATSPGVTGTEIRVALPVSNYTKPTGTWPDLKPLVDFVNTRFQLYGRQIRIVPFVSQQAVRQHQGTFNDPAAQRADAAEITQLKVFASIDFVDPINYSMSLPVFRDVLTKHKIISVAGGETSPYGDEKGFAAHRPYEWTYYPTIDLLMKSVATMTCRQLAGKPAAHAPDTNLNTKIRKFALLIPTDQQLGGPLPGLSDALSILAGCGVTDPKVVRYGTGSENRASNTASLRQLANEGVTSLLYFPGGGSGVSGQMDLAAQVGFRPEWIMIGHHKYQVDFHLGSPRTETAGAFGVGNWNKMPAPALEMWNQAYLAAGGSTDVLEGGLLNSARPFYQELLLLASGIQMAGPELTPNTFAEGLRATAFPNPGAAGPPFYQATVGFGPSDSTMIRDFVGFWLDTRTTSADVTRSKNLNTYTANCYAESGRRWAWDAWPTTDRFYEPGVCR
jgi:hypothetical protein